MCHLPADRGRYTFLTWHRPSICCYTSCTHPPCHQLDRHYARRTRCARCYRWRDLTRSMDCLKRPWSVCMKFWMVATLLPYSMLLQWQQAVVEAFKVLQVAQWATWADERAKLPR